MFKVNVDQVPQVECMLWQYVIQIVNSEKGCIFYPERKFKTLSLSRTLTLFTSVGSDEIFNLKNDAIVWIKVL